MNGALDGDNGQALTIPLPVPAHGARNVLYAAAFIDPAVQAVSLTDEGWRFRLAEAVAPERLEAGLRALIARFDAAETDEPAPLFQLEMPGALKTRRGAAVAELQAACQEIHPGLFVFRPPLSTLVRFLDHAILARFARPFDAVEECYPNAIPLKSLGRAHHLSSFPEHLHFLTHLREDLDVLDDFAAAARDNVAADRPRLTEVSPVVLVQNPSTCYHCYAARAETEVADNTAITAITKCHRYEAANHSELGRLLEFSLREVIFLGTPDYVRATREKTLELTQALAEDWQLFGALAAANDPFFTSDFEAKAVHQRRLAMKFEYRAELPGQERMLAVMSSNLHGPTFSKSFAMRREGGGVLNTGCLGFGLERLALAIHAQHGADPAAWPSGLARDYQAWRKTDPLTA
jgi:hypothetical protein